MITKEKERAINIRTEPPGPKAKEAIERSKQHVSSVMYNILPNFVQKSGRGSIIEDVDGNRYIDFLTGVGVNAIGHAHPRVVRAITEQAEIGIHFNEHVGIIENYTNFLAKVEETMPGSLKLGKGFLGNSGTEGVEGGTKLARYYTAKLNGIAFDPSFHGRTLGSLAATTGAKGRIRMGGVLNGIIHAKYPYPYRMKNATEESIGSIEEILHNRSPPENTAFVLIETIAGEPGYIIPPKDFYPKLRKLCDDNNMLLICDEVQMGFGKTGKWWAFEHYGIEPDIVTFAKPAGGGLPLGGLIAKQHIADGWLSGHHASTFGGNPVATAAGMATIDVIREEKLVERAESVGAATLKRLQEFDYEQIGEARGIGMLFAIELVKDRKTKEPAAKEATEIKLAAFKKGLITSTTGPYANVIRISPALNIPQEMLDEGIDVLDQAFKEVLKK